MKQPRWRKSVANHDYEAAYNYLSLRFNHARAERLALAMSEADLQLRRVNDILRACDLPPLPESDPGVVRTMDKIEAGEKLSPVLLVSFNIGGDIADGYHRVSAAYHLDPFAEIPVCLVDG